MSVIVVGGGLAGCSAAHTALEHGCSVLMIDKSAFLGGNSTKATSGINGSETRTQKALGIEDSNEAFEEDMVRSASGYKKGPDWKKHSFDLAVITTHQSGPGVHWLQDKFGLKLDKVERLGGHTNPRTHRTGVGGKFPGMEITYTLIEALEEEAKKGRAQIITRAKVNELIVEDGKVVGVKYEKGGKTIEARAGAVIVATGGYAAGGLFEDSVLKKIRPDLMGFATTNGVHCTGDALQFSEAVDADGVDLEYVQVHPTGLINPKLPNAKVLFLAAEALRGAGGILLDRDGNRFVNELETRDYVSAVMQKHNKPPYRLCLNTIASSEILWHCKHYTGRGVMKALTGKELAKEIGVSESHLSKQLEKYNAAAKSGKPCEFGRKHYKGAPFHITDNGYHVAIVTPVVHYSMGGIKIDKDAAVINKANAVVPGYYAAGEVTGGVHGKNRLGGSALLECVVWGRVAGNSGAEYAKGVSSKVAGKAQKGEAKKAPSGGKGLKVYTMQEVAKHNTEKDCWVVVNGQVLNVTDFLEDHPGGAMAIFTFAGKDASEEFNMLHEKNVVEKYAPHCVIGTVAGKAKL